MKTLYFLRLLLFNSAIKILNNELGNAPPSSKASSRTQSASGAEGMAAGQGGNLTLDHDLDHNLDLVPSGEAPPRTQSASGGGAVRQRAEVRGQRSEEGCDFVLQAADGELVMREDCPELPEQITDSMRTRIWGEAPVREMVDAVFLEQAGSKRSRCIGTSVHALAEFGAALSMTSILGDFAEG